METRLPAAYGSSDSINFLEQGQKLTPEMTMTALETRVLSYSKNFRGKKKKCTAAA